MPVVSAALRVCALDAHFYFRRLTRYGYDIPDRKSVLLAIRFQKLGSDAWLFDVCMFVVCVCWFMTALVYRRQMRTDLYRDDVAIDTSGKTRQNIVMGMFGVVFGAFVSEFVFYMIYKVADYILRARG